MLELSLNADDLVNALLTIAEAEPVCLLDSSAVGHSGSHLLIAGIRPETSDSINEVDPQVVLNRLDAMYRGEHAAFFTLSYDLGLKLQDIISRHYDPDSMEPDLFVATFRCLIIHDYRANRTTITGDGAECRHVLDILAQAPRRGPKELSSTSASSNFSKSEYLAAIETVKDRIRRGDTYQTNLTQRIELDLRASGSPGAVFSRLRKRNPSPFSAFMVRDDSTVISASPERFFRVSGDRIVVSPIKGTRPRGSDPVNDEKLRNELMTSEKDLAENTMIVDLLRNDIGRFCEFGSVLVEDLCRLEEHPSLFHLVSNVIGTLRANVTIADIIRAVFPCGSITGAPKISTMKIIDEIETVGRGLSMGALGYFVPSEAFGLPRTLDLSVAIRTAVVRGQKATFNVGGGIVIDSDPESEYAETLTKATALIDAFGADLNPIDK